MTPSKDFIKNYWEKQAKLHKGSHKASWGDNFMIDLEIHTIGQHLREGAKILDAGCANGCSALRQISERGLTSINGVDFSRNMISQANAAKAKLGLSGKAFFKVGDIRSLKFPNNTFDVVYTTRAVINLPNWKEQVLAIRECLRVAKPGGKVILSEAFWEPLILLNSLRALKQLPPLIEHDFNRYLKKESLERFLDSKNLKFKVDDFSSIYYLGSRFLRELVTDPSQYPGFTNPINELFYRIEKSFSGGGFGIQQAYIITK